MAPSNLQFFIGFTSLIGLLVFFGCLYLRPGLLTGDRVDNVRYYLEDYDGVWFRCTREQWLDEKTKIAGVHPIRRSRLLPPDLKF